MSDRKIKNVLVTGGAGYIGSHTCKELHSRGIIPITLDNLSTGHTEFVQWGPLFRGDLNSTTDISRVFAEFPIDAVLHFAASAYVNDSLQNPSPYYENNVVATKKLLDQMVKTGVKKIVFSSSCAVYGNMQSSNLSEADPLNPISPYGRTKLICEQMISDYAQAYDLKCIALRYFNAAGADPDGQIGEWHEPETHLIPNILGATFEDGKNNLRVYGRDFPTPDGTTIRDYVHVSDLASAHALALFALDEGCSFLPLNLGTGTGYSIKNIINIAESVTGGKIEFSYEDRRPGDPPALVADPQKARKHLKWEATRSSMDNILRTAYYWHRYKSSLAREASISNIRSAFL
jgi:UDP-glucose-4-epimerase GalE